MISFGNNDWSFDYEPNVDLLFNNRYKYIRNGFVQIFSEPQHKYYGLFWISLDNQILWDDTKNSIKYGENKKPLFQIHQVELQNLFTRIIKLQAFQ